MTIIKRRVAAAKLAVAFVAAGTIAGAGAWAQADTRPPIAHSSASDYLLKANSVNSADIKNGTLLFKDFKRGQVPSAAQFVKLRQDELQFNKITDAAISSVKGDISSIKGELGTLSAKIGGVSGELISSYLKLSDADSRYIKQSEPVVRGDGSVFSGSQLVNLQAQTFTPLVSVPGMLSVEAMGAKVRITNISGGDLGHSACTFGQDKVQAGTLQNGAFLECDASDTTESIQFFSWGREVSATVSLSSVPGPAGTAQDTVQILVGL